MAESEPQPQLSVSSVAEPEPLQYWCYQCDKRVSIETQTNELEIICYECKNGFVELIPVAAPSEQIPSAANGNQERSFSHQFLQVLRLLAQAARDEDAPPPPPPNASETDDFLRIELDGWHNDVDDDDEEDEIEFGNNDGDRSDNDIGDEEDEEPDGGEVGRRRRRRDILRLRIRDFASRAASRRNRILEWSEIVMGLEENAIELHFEMPDSDGYIGNPEDYVDAAGYEALLQNLVESEVGTRRGAPPAAKSAVLGLKSVEVTVEKEVLMCAICKESVAVGNTAKELPCGHGYHGECIEQWLGSRNSCPVCRFELPTDDPDYEEERKKRSSIGSATGGSSSSGENNSVSG